MVSRIGDGYLTCMSKIQDLELRVVLLEAFLNQQSQLVVTLGSVMAELKRLEH